MRRPHLFAAFRTIQKTTPPDGAFSLPFSQNFDDVPVGTLPTDLAFYSSGSPTTFAVSNDKAQSGRHSLKFTAGSGGRFRLYPKETIQANVRVSTTVYIDPLSKAMVFARGSNVAGASQTWYYAAINRSTVATVGKYVNGAHTLLGSIASKVYTQNFWATVTLYCNDDNLRVQVLRHDTGYYLSSTGTWVASQTWALNVTDSEITSGGQCGIAREKAYSETLYFDNFYIEDASGDAIPPSVSITAPADLDEVTGDVVVSVSASDAAGVAKVEFYVDGILRATDVAAPFTWTFDTTSASNGDHEIEARAYDVSDNIGTDSITVTTNNDTAITQPTIVKKLPHIGIALLAYSTWDNWVSGGLDATAEDLIENYVDIVIPSSIYRAAIKAIDPDIQALEYTNFGNLYLGLVTQWNAYADDNAISREDAFVHVSEEVGFAGNSPSSKPVRELWMVAVGSVHYYYEAASALDNDVPYPNTVAATLVAGYPEKFCELNFVMDTPASGGWAAVLEYCTAVDGSNYPTTWTTLPTKTDTTSGLTTDGQITFDPPADWITCYHPSAESFGRLFYLRWRVTSTGTRPIAVTIHGRDYTGQGSTDTGVMPAFDYAADLDEDGYLNDTEYAARASGYDARFVYEGRCFTTYGSWRFVSNVGNTNFRDFLLVYHDNTTEADMDGFMVDNSVAETIGATSLLIETVSSYAEDYAALLSTLWNHIEPRWLMPNTSAAHPDNIVLMGQRCPAYLHEFSIRAMNETALMISERRTLFNNLAAASSPEPIGVVDTYPPGGGFLVTDYRLRLYAVCSYYLTKTANQYYMPFGGTDPQGQWSERWSDAYTYNIGDPTGPYTVRETGVDPSNAAHTYSILQRNFDNAMILLRPLPVLGSSDRSIASAVTVDLGGSYQAVLDDGTLDTAITEIDLMNGEAAILVPVP